MTNEEHGPEFELTKDTQYLIITDGLWVSFVSILEKIDCIITTLYSTLRNSSFPDGTILADTDW